MRLLVVVDNRAKGGLRAEWGWSAYIEAHGYRVLFDAGASPSTIEFNAGKLGLDLSSLDFAVLSHHHADHYGGFEYVGRVAKGLTVYTPPGELNRLREWGLNPIPITSPSKVVEGFWLTGPLRAGKGWILEQGLAVSTSEGLVVVVGCSHPGVDRLTSAAKSVSGMEVFLVMGGFHMPGKRVLDELAGMSRRICPAHCSGEGSLRYLRRGYPEKFCEVAAGSLLELLSLEKGTR